MPLRTQRQLDLLEQLKTLTALSAVEYPGTLSHSQVRWNICNWQTNRNFENKRELDGEFKTFVWRKRLFLVKMPPTQGRLV